MMMTNLVIINQTAHHWQLSTSFMINPFANKVRKTPSIYQPGRVQQHICFISYDLRNDPSTFRALITRLWRGQSGECSFIISEIRWFIYFFFVCARCLRTEQQSILFIIHSAADSDNTLIFHQCGLLIALLIRLLSTSQGHWQKCVFFYYFVCGAMKKYKIREMQAKRKVFLLRRIKIKCVFRYLSLQARSSKLTSSYWQHVPRTLLTYSRRHRWLPVRCALSLKRRRPRTWPRCWSSCTRAKCMCHRKLWKAF